MKLIYSISHPKMKFTELSILSLSTFPTAFATTYSCPHNTTTRTRYLVLLHRIRRYCTKYNIHISSGNIANVRRTSCGVLTWDVPSDSSEGLTYKIRFYGGQSFGSTPSSQKKVLASPTNSLAFTAEDVPSTRPLYAIVSS